MRILIVEDDQKLARQLKKGLAEQGYTVRLAFEGSALRAMALIASRMRPRIACPKPNRDARISVVSESHIPAPQVTTAATPKASNNRASDNSANICFLIRSYL